MTVDAPALSPDELADLLLKGKENYPDVTHTTGQLFEFASVLGEAKPVAACAIGYILLGKYNGDLSQENLDDYYAEFERAVPSDTILDAIVAYNDNDGFTIEEIAKEIRDWKPDDWEGLR